MQLPQGPRRLPRTSRGRLVSRRTAGWP
jgi:hypothetical protein